MTTQERIDKMLKKSEAILNAGKQTNDDWRKTCSAEEFAEWISKHFDCSAYCPARRKMCAWTNDNCRKAWVDWLKEKHK